MKKAIILSLVAIFVSFASVTAQTAKATVPAKAKTETKACCKATTAEKADCTKDAKTCTKKAEGKACCKATTADKAACTKDAITCTKKADGKACCKEVAKAAPVKK